MMYVYVIRSLNDGRFYVGMTSDVENRLSEHNSGKTKSTKAFAPWALVFVETFPGRTEARKREKYLKGGSGKEYIKRYWSGSSTG
jgi:putative endonuclease